MNRKRITHIVVLILRMEAIFLIMPMIVALIYGEHHTLLAFAIPIILSSALSFLLELTAKSGDQIVYNAGKVADIGYNDSTVVICKIR